MELLKIGVTFTVAIAGGACYEPELREYPHPRSLRALAERAAYWGSVVGGTAVEPFVVLRNHA